MAARCTRIWWVRPVSSCTSQQRAPAAGCSASSKCVTAGSCATSRSRAAMRGDRAGRGRSAPRSCPRRGGRPAAHQRQVRCGGCGGGAAAAAGGPSVRSSRATTSRPEVSRSSRCTMPGRAPSPPISPGQAMTSVGPRSSRARGGRAGRPACPPPAGARPGTSTGRSSSHRTQRRATGSALGEADRCAGRQPVGLARAAARPPCTARASISRSAAPAMPTSDRAARKRSSRSPPASAGTPPVHQASPVGSGRAGCGACRAAQAQQQQRHADHDEGVGQVEGRPVRQVDEVRHVAVSDTVGQVRDAAADQQAQRHRKQHVAGAGAGEVHQHPDHRGSRQQRITLEPAGQDAEGDAGVADVRDVRGRAARGASRPAPYAARSGASSPGPRPAPAVATASRPAHCSDPAARRAGSQRAQLLDQPRSSSRLHSMHLVAYGSASRRSSPIWSPQRSQRP